MMICAEIGVLVCYSVGETEGNRLCAAVSVTVCYRVGRRGVTSRYRILCLICLFIY